MVSSVQENPVQNEPSSDSGAPAIVILPGHLFFVRSLELPTGIRPEEVESFVEVSTEQISPFTLAQLYYGYYLPPESSRLLVFAAYRKKLQAFADEAWENAELVVPDFVSILALEHEGPTLVFLQNDADIMLAYWPAGGGVPERLVSRHVHSESALTSAEEVREELRRKIGHVPASARTILLEGPVRARFRDRNLVFDLRQAGGADGPSVEIPRPAFWTTDVRDKAFLQASRKVRQQNRWLWNGVIAIVACFLALAVFEVGLFAGRKILQSRLERVEALEPEVARVQEEEALASRLEELSGQRLLPFEFLQFINRIRPSSVYFTTVSTSGLRSMQIEARTPRAADADRFQEALQRAEGVESVEVQNQQVGRDGTSFTLTVRVTEEALRRISAPPEPRSRGRRMPALPADPAPGPEAPPAEEEEAPL